MRTVIVFLSLVMIFSSAAFNPVCFAMEDMCKMGSNQKDKVINDTCPVCKGKVNKNKPIKTEYKGVAIGFNCQRCVQRFKESPRKYLSHLKDECEKRCGEKESCPIIARLFEDE